MSKLISAFDACSIPAEGTKQVQWCWQRFSTTTRTLKHHMFKGFQVVQPWNHLVAQYNFFHLFSFTHLKTHSTKTAWRNKEFRNSYSQNQWDLGSSVSPETWASGYRYFCKIIAGGPLVPLNHTICKCIKNTHKETVLNMLIARLPAGPVHVNTAQFNTIFRKTMQQKTSSKQSPPKCFEAWPTTILFSKGDHLYCYQPSYYPPACYRLVSDGTLSRS